MAKLQSTYKKRLRDEWARWTAPESGAAAQDVARIVEENPRVFTNKSQLLETLQSIRALDEAFDKRNGKFFKTSQPLKTALDFTMTHVFDYRQKGRPSLPALSKHHAEIMGLDDMDYKALMLISVRAEMKSEASPEYHNKFHYLDVAAMTANLLEKNAELAAKGEAGAVALTPHEQALTQIAAVIHDLDHAGKSNPTDNLTFNEQKSFKLAEPILRKAGLSKADCDVIQALLLSTSPDVLTDEEGKRLYGPHEIIKAVVEAHRKGAEPDMATIDPLNGYPALHKLKDRRKAEMAAMLGDGDIYGSSCCLIANRKYSQLFAEEKKKAGENADLLSDEARKWFLDNIIGSTYLSYAAQVVADTSLRALRMKTESNIGKAASKAAAKAVSVVKRNPAS